VEKLRSVEAVYGVPVPEPTVECEAVVREP
jgi:hypothetical protein